MAQYNSTTLSPKPDVKLRYKTTQEGNVSISIDLKSYGVEFN
jgi:hypothetical protein